MLIYAISYNWDSHTWKEVPDPVCRLVQLYATQEKPYLLFHKQASKWSGGLKYIHVAHASVNHWNVHSLGG